MPIKTYETEVVNLLEQLAKEGKGEVFTLCSYFNADNEKVSVKGFAKGKNPKTLVTACHHANEMYGTYDGILEYAANGKGDAILVPVVDVENFC